MDVVIRGHGTNGCPEDGRVGLTHRIAGCHELKALPEPVTGGELGANDELPGTEHGPARDVKHSFL